jgi:hypothetical protein
MWLSSAAEAAGYRLSANDTLASTNAEALALATAVRFGSWRANSGPRGNSLGLAAPPDCAPQLSFVAALALHGAIAEPRRHCGRRRRLNARMSLRRHQSRRVVALKMKLMAIPTRIERAAGYSCDARNCGVECPLEGDHRLLYVGIADRKDLHQGDGRNALLKINPEVRVVDPAPRPGAIRPKCSRAATQIQASLMSHVGPFLQRRLPRLMSKIG